VSGSTERRWLQACLAALGRRRLPPSAPALDWDVLLALAQSEQVLPALAYAVVVRGTPAPPAPRARLAGALAAARAGHVVMTRALAEVLAGFRAEAIPVIVLKGPVLAETVYPEPALRPFADLDLLVTPDDRRRADAALIALGCRRLADAHSWQFDVAYDGATVYETPGGIHVDLHWMLLTEPRYAWNQAAERLVWCRATPIALAGEPALVLAREDLVLHLAAHLAVHHALAGLLRHWDIALVLSAGGLDWDVLLARAAEWRTRRALGLVLAGAEAAFGPLVPPAALTALAPRGARAALLAALLHDADAARRVRLEHLVTLLLVDRGRDACGALWNALWPSTDWLRARYGDQARSRAALYRAHARQLRSVLAGLRH
jgi:Uncharacterised nucleotidyltransferase